MKNKSLSADARAKHSTRFPVKHQSISKTRESNLQKTATKEPNKSAHQSTASQPNPKGTAAKKRHPEMKASSSTSIATTLITDDSFEALLARHKALHHSTQKKERDEHVTGELSMSWKLKPQQPQQKEEKEDRANRRSASRNTFRKMKR